MAAAQPSRPYPSPLIADPVDMQQFGPADGPYTELITLAELVDEIYNHAQGLKVPQHILVRLSQYPMDIRLTPFDEDEIVRIPRISNSHEINKYPGINIFNMATKKVVEQSVTEKYGILSILCDLIEEFFESTLEDAGSFLSSNNKGRAKLNELCSDPTAREELFSFPSLTKLAYNKLNRDDKENIKLAVIEGIIPDPRKSTKKRGGKKINHTRHKSNKKTKHKKRKQKKTKRKKMRRRK